MFPNFEMATYQNASDPPVTVALTANVAALIPHSIHGVDVEYTIENDGGHPVYVAQAVTADPSQAIRTVMPGKSEALVLDGPVYVYSAYDVPVRVTYRSTGAILATKAGTGDGRYVAPDLAATGLPSGPAPRGAFAYDAQGERYVGNGGVDWVPRPEGEVHTDIYYNLTPLPALLTTTNVNFPAVSESSGNPAITSTATDLYFTTFVVDRPIDVVGVWFPHRTPLTSTAFNLKMAIFSADPQNTNRPLKLVDPNAQYSASFAANAAAQMYFVPPMSGKRDAVRLMPGTYFVAHTTDIVGGVSPSGGWMRQRTVYALQGMVSDRVLPGVNFNTLDFTTMLRPVTSNSSAFGAIVLGLACRRMP